MTEAVSHLLESRDDEHRRRGPRWAAVAAALLHLAILGSVAWSGYAKRRVPQVREYAPVVLLPAARLGIERRQAAPREVAPAPAPRAQPTPAPRQSPTPDPKSKKSETSRERTAKAPAAPEARSSSTSSPPSPLDEPPGMAQGSPAGVAFGSSSVRFDQPDFTYGYYVDQMLALISTNWVRPPVGSGVEAIVSFRIDRTGRVSELRISRSSGINSFDLAALRAVQSSSPLPPLPRAFREGSLGVHLIVR